MKITIQYTLEPWKVLKYDRFTFSGGEEHIRLDLKGLPQSRIHRIMITTRLTSSAAVMELVMATNALREVFNEVDIELQCHYFPYARQDRVCYPGEAYGVKAMAALINHLNFEHVYVTDPHSASVANWVNRCVVLPQDSLPILHWVPGLAKNDMIVSPDAGATDKAVAMQSALSTPELIQASKKRDCFTGNIIRTEVEGDVQGKSILIPDDICDGGRTFIELAKVLRGMGAGPITLFVTHGIFSKGFEGFVGYVDEIVTTDSIRSKEEQHTLNTSEIPLHIMRLNK